MAAVAVNLGFLPAAGFQVGKCVGLLLLGEGGVSADVGGPGEGVAQVAGQFSADAADRRLCRLRDGRVEL